MIGSAFGMMGSGNRPSNTQQMRGNAAGNRFGMNGPQGPQFNKGPSKVRPPDEPTIGPSMGFQNRMMGASQPQMQPQLQPPQQANDPMPQVPDLGSRDPSQQIYSQNFGLSPSMPFSGNPFGMMEQPYGRPDVMPRVPNEGVGGGLGPSNPERISVAGFAGRDRRGGIAY